MPAGFCSGGYRLEGLGRCGLVASCAEGLVVGPALVDFGEVVRGRTGYRTVTLSNPAPYDNCSIEELVLLSGTDPAFGLPGGAPAGLSLAPGATLPVEVAFAPSGGETASGFLSVTDEVGGIWVVRLLGQGLDVAASVSPPAIDFGTVAVPCSWPVAELCLTNEGGRGLTLTEATLSVNTDLRIVEGPSLPVVVAPGARACWIIVYAPIAEGGDSAEMRITADPGALTFILPISGEGAASAPITESYLQTNERKVDLLWVIDDSSMSMTQEQESLSAEAPALLTLLEQEAIDYQVGVISTNASGSYAPVPGMMFPYDRSRPHIVTPSLADPAGVLMENLLVGYWGSATEQGLEAARLALSESLTSEGGVNAGFLRPDAHLAIVFVSDEPEQSLDPVADYLAFYRGLNLTSRPDLFVASAIVGPSPAGCSGPGGNAGAGTRYWEIAAQTGGVQGSICGFDWLGVLQGTIDRFGSTFIYPLSRPMLGVSPSAVTVVAADGSRSSATGWTYDPALHVVHFDPANVPDAGETVEVTYITACN